MLMFLWIPLFAQEVPQPVSDTLPLDSPLVIGGAVAVVLGAMAFWLVVRRWRGKQVVDQPTNANLKLDVNALPSGGPIKGKPYLEFYSVPVRLAAIVVAPVGRDGRLPSNEHLPLVMEAILPGLMKVLTAHQPQFIRWPAQLSTQGFAHAMFNNVPLPGEHGRGTPWCSLAGKVELEVGHFLVGMVCSAATPNSLGEVIVKHAAGWPEVIRVKRA